MTDVQLLQVTMTPEAAVRFREALRYAAARVQPEDSPGPKNATELKAFEYVQWLHWGVARIDAARGPAGEEQTA